MAFTDRCDEVGYLYPPTDEEKIKKWLMAEIVIHMTNCTKHHCDR